MDSARLSNKIGIEGAEHNSGVAYCAVVVKLNEVAAIVRQQNSILRSCEGKHFGIRHGCVCVTGFVGSEYVVAQTSQLQYYI